MRKQTGTRGQNMDAETHAESSSTARRVSRGGTRQLQTQQTRKLQDIKAETPRPEQTEDFGSKTQNEEGRATLEAVVAEVNDAHAQQPLLAGRDRQGAKELPKLAERRGDGACEVIVGEMEGAEVPEVGQLRRDGSAQRVARQRQRLELRELADADGKLA
eukprot:3263656-Rhodomonas_salina.1